MHTPGPKEDMGIPKNLTHFSLGNPPKLSTFLVARVKETWEFPKYSIVFGTKNRNFQFFTIFDIKNWKFPFLKTIFRIPIFLRSKFEPGNSQIFNLKYVCLHREVPLISGIAQYQVNWVGICPPSKLLCPPSKLNLPIAQNCQPRKISCPQKKKALRLLQIGNLDQNLCKID